VRAQQNGARGTTCADALRGGGSDGGDVIAMWALEHQATWERPHSGVDAPPLIGRRRATHYERYVKPAIDKVVALVLVIALLPVFVVVAVLTRVTLGRGIILRQTRIGR